MKLGNNLIKRSKYLHNAEWKLLHCVYEWITQVWFFFHAYKLLLYSHRIRSWWAGFCTARVPVVGCCSCWWSLLCALSHDGASGTASVISRFFGFWRRFLRAFITVTADRLARSRMPPLYNFCIETRERERESCFSFSFNAVTQSFKRW